MKLVADCYSCQLSHVQKIARLHQVDDQSALELQNKIFQLFQSSIATTPVKLASHVQGLLSMELDSAIKFERIRHKANDLVLHFATKLEKMISKSKDRYETCMRLACIGNVLDYTKIKTEEDLYRHVQELMERKFSVSNLYACSLILKKTTTIFYLLDQCGEIVFDKLLIKYLLQMGKKISIGVRKNALFMAANFEDALQVGLGEIAQLVSPEEERFGICLNSCGKEFRHYYDNADLVISKGQTNFLSLNQQNKSIAFLFFVKCHALEKLYKMKKRDMILKMHYEDKKRTN